MIIDGNPSRKTEIIRKTWTPSWNENFDMYLLYKQKFCFFWKIFNFFLTFQRLVTANSRIEFRTFNHHSFKADTLLGQCLIFLNKLSQDTSHSNCNTLFIFYNFNVSYINNCYDSD